MNLLLAFNKSSFSIGIIVSFLVLIIIGVLRIVVLTKKTNDLNTLLKSVFFNIDIALVLLSEDYKINLLNSLAVSMLYEGNHTKLIGKPWDKFISPIVEPVYNKISSSLEEVSDFSREYRVFLPEGAKYIECSLIVLKESKKSKTKYLLSFIDKTKEDEIRQKLLLQSEETSRHIASKVNFFSNMSHEVRTPINAIIGLSSIAKNTNSLEKALEYFAKIEKSSEKLLSVLNEILDFSRIQEEEFKLVNEDFNLMGIKNILKDLFLINAIKKQINLAIKFDCESPFIVNGDQFRLTQIFMNLIENAIKFTKTGTVTVNLSYEFLKEDVILRCFVKDTGEGIEEEKVSSIFTDYQRFGEVLDKDHEGTGLGLAITKRLVELMNGVIWVDSELKRGSTFYFIVVLKKKKNDLNI